MDTNLSRAELCWGLCVIITRIVDISYFDSLKLTRENTGTQSRALLPETGDFGSGDSFLFFKRFDVFESVLIGFQVERPSTKDGKPNFKRLRGHRSPNYLRVRLVQRVEVLGQDGRVVHVGPKRRKFVTLLCT